MREKNKNRGEVVWRDSKTLDWIRLLFSSLFFIFSLYFFFSSKPNKEIYRLFLLPVILLCLFLVYSQIRKKNIVMTFEGIRMGNLVYWADDKIILKQKPTFFTWQEIKEINILSKSYRQGIYGGRDFYHVHLKNKQNKLYDCLIYNPNGFVQALKKVQKINLLEKNQRRNIIKQ